MKPPRRITIQARAILFDMDGTLIDSSQVVTALWREFSERYHLDTAAVNTYAQGRPTADTVRHFLPAHAHVDLIIERFQQEELIRAEEITPIPGAAQLLQRLPDQRIAVVTSAPCALALHRMRAARLPIPSQLVTSENLTKTKPDPEPFLAAARLLDQRVCDCLVFEDAPSGISAATNAKMRTLIVRGQSIDTNSLDPRYVLGFINDFTSIRVERELPTSDDIRLSVE